MLGGVGVNVGSAVDADGPAVSPGVGDEQLVKMKIDASNKPKPNILFFIFSLSVH
jgi:hypothetical protein